MTEQRMVDVELLECLEMICANFLAVAALKSLPVPATEKATSMLRAIIASPNVGWQPISTAPKSSRVILLLDNKSVVCGSWQEDKYRKNPRPYWSNDLEHIFGVMQTRSNQPTHWMPLPQPPKED